MQLVSLVSCMSVYLSQLIVATSPEDEYQEPLNHRGEHQATRNRIALAQYECFQRMVKESHTKTKTIGEKMMSKSSREFYLFIFFDATVLHYCVCPFVVSRAGVQQNLGRVAVLGRN